MSVFEAKSDLSYLVTETINQKSIFFKPIVFVTQVGQVEHLTQYQQTRDYKLIDLPMQAEPVLIIGDS
jgi:hypothetical protein